MWKRNESRSRSRSQAWLWIGGCLIVAMSSTQLAADVIPPLSAELKVIRELADGYEVEVSSVVPAPAMSHERRLLLTLETSGAARIQGQTQWEIEPVEPGRVYRFTAHVSIGNLGEGSVHLQAESFDHNGLRAWGRADALFLLHTPDDHLHGKSSLFELKREKLVRDMARGRLDQRHYQQEFDKLLHSKTLEFERNMPATPGPSPEPSEIVPDQQQAVVNSTVVSGRVTYTPRISRSGSTDVFADAGHALPVRRTTISFFDRNGASLLPLASTPPTVRTDDSGAYSATVPGKRGDGSAVQLVVRVMAANAAARLGPSGQRTTVYSKDSLTVAVSAAATTVDLLVDNSNLLSLQTFSILDGVLTAFSFVTDNDASTGVGHDPAQIFVEFPGASSTNSAFSSSPDDHLNIGQGHAFDWDVYTHEYGHYVQRLNNTTQNPGGCHRLSVSMTGFNQASSPCNGPNRTLTKQQGIALAWGEGWPTFFGTTLQIASGAGALGIYGVADTFYTDSANNFSYDLEGDADLRPGVGEDNELSVQRILWDFADQQQDAHDELTYGNTEMWRQVAADPTIVTLDAFRAKLDGLLPGSPAGYSTGTAEQNRAKQGRIYFDLNVGPAPLEPADNADLDPTHPPLFRWEAKGASGSPSYRFNKFRVKFFTEDYGRLIFTSAEIASTGDEASWTPTTAQWATINTADPGGLSGVVKWVVEGSNDSLAPATGPYRGIDRTLGTIDEAFVIDDTGSMSDEIAGVRNALTIHIANIRSLHLPKNPLIEVITFKDEVSHRIISRDLDAIQAVVSSLVAVGGGDCPEASAEALLEVVHNLGSGKAIQFATDAAPHPGFDLTGIKADIHNRGINLTEIVSGDCTVHFAVAAAAGAQENANHDPRYRPQHHLPPVPDFYRTVSCPDCPPDTSVGPSLSPNALALVGDPSLAVPSSIVAFEDIASSSPLSRFLFFPGVKLGDPEPFTHTMANAALSAIVPAVIAVQPGDLYTGARLNVQILGGKTNFKGTSQVSWSTPGIHVNKVTVLSPTTLLLDITVDAAVPPGFVDVSVRTPLGDGAIETTAGFGQARVLAGDGQPRITSVQPSTVTRGTSADLLVTGLDTSFVVPLDVTIADLEINSVSVLSPTSLRVNVTAPAGATLGFRDIGIAGPAAPVFISRGLSVVDVATPVSVLPTLARVFPLGVPRGTFASMTITGSGTHFLAGVSTVSFSGDGITVLSMHVVSPTSVTLDIAVASGASLGFRDVIVATGGETAVLVAGLSVDAAATAPAAIPTLGFTGMTLLSLLLATAAVAALRAHRDRRGRKA